MRTGPGNSMLGTASTCTVVSTSPGYPEPESEIDCRGGRPGYNQPGPFRTPKSSASHVGEQVFLPSPLGGEGLGVRENALHRHYPSSPTPLPQGARGERF